MNAPNPAWSIQYENGLLSLQIMCSAYSRQRQCCFSKLVYKKREKKKSRRNRGRMILGEYLRELMHAVLLMHAITIMCEKHACVAHFPLIFPTPHLIRVVGTFYTVVYFHLFPRAYEMHCHFYMYCVFPCKCIKFCCEKVFHWRSTSNWYNNFDTACRLISDCTMFMNH